MSANDIDESSEATPLSGIPLAKRFYEIALQEYSTDDTERMRDGCEKAYRAALEAIDVLLAFKGIHIDIGQPEAHWQRASGLSKLVEIDPNMKKIQLQYSNFVQDLHGAGFYSREDPRNFKKQFENVKEFIDTIEQLIIIVK